MLTRGDVIGGKYRLIDSLGEGGMGAVWVAENVSIRGAEVAVKVLHAHFAHDPDAVRRFRAEAEATVRIGHPNIVRVFDYGVSSEATPGDLDDPPATANIGSWVLCNPEQSRVRKC